jgi:hypothetical protein
MHKLFVLLGLVLAATACTPDADVTNPAIATEEAVIERMADAPATGANSFTREQAISHLIDKGYTDPTGLVLSETGTWRGEAMFNNKIVAVAVDYQGNVATE